MRERERIARIISGGLISERDRMHGGGFMVLGLDMKPAEGPFDDWDDAHTALVRIQTDAILALPAGVEATGGAVAWGHAYRRRSFEDGIPIEGAPWNLQRETDGFLMLLKGDPEHWEVQSLYTHPPAVEGPVGALTGCSELFDEIRGDYSDPRHECREGQLVIRAALKGGNHE
jgi:hypothetical protein